MHTLQQKGDNFLNFAAVTQPTPSTLSTRTRAANKSGRGGEGQGQDSADWQQVVASSLRSFITSASVQLRDFAQIMF